MITRSEVAVEPWFDGIVQGSKMKGWVVRRLGSQQYLGRYEVGGPLDWQSFGMAALCDTAAQAEAVFEEFERQAVK